uniref:Uncharacterized protein n=1 Tax=Acrobeloides nanus TaxID=290746 RepID=A0A914C5C7_9BILA
MPRTLHYLKEKYGAISFPYFNKVGLNSRPNGYALLLGKAYADFKPTFCSIPLDYDQFIGYEFKEAGYKTLMSEDWAKGVFNYPDCKGFTNSTPMDHYMR